MGIIDKFAGLLKSAEKEQPDRCDIHMKMISFLKETTDKHLAGLIENAENTLKLNDIYQRESVRIAEWEKKCEARLKKLEENIRPGNV